ncbi:hypothetical protein HLB35_12320 [Halomonas sp. TBZ9]|uniref:Uncharacterized protein n=1 Tax=Vreelandella azerica TaxID=2732867 RepID=A0A7Y3TY26_9GAMM|nr:hypothetical protein [Halomonas azerica]NOG32342.1 hypothetical protein [Halomonas azerica]
MSGQDQASGLRKWANLQRQQQEPQGQVDEEGRVDALSTEQPSAPEPAPESLEPEPKPEPNPEPALKKRLMVVGLPSIANSQVDRVRGRLEQWSALGRHWAGKPENWDIHVVMADDPALHDYARRYSRWALWVNSHADSFVDTFRTLRQLRESGGPQRLLALHEPNLPRAGLLNNLQAAAQAYLDIELLILAR